MFVEPQNCYYKITLNNEYSLMFILLVVMVLENPITLAAYPTPYSFFNSLPSDKFIKLVIIGDIT